MTLIIRAIVWSSAYPPAGRQVADFRCGRARVASEIFEREIYGILGPNGAGKTTTLEMLEGLNDIDGGSAFVDGIDVAKDPYSVKKIIGVQLQESEYFDKLNLIELLDLFGALYRRDIDAMELLGKVHRPKAKARPANLSGGQKQRFSSPAPGLAPKIPVFSTSRPPGSTPRPSAACGTW